MSMKLGYAVAIAAIGTCAAIAIAQSPKAQTAAQSCPGGEAGITLPEGFCATIFADNVGHSRHMVVTADGTLYVNTWSGRYYRNAPPGPTGPMLIALRDNDGDGKAEAIERFGPTLTEGNGGGTGIALYRNGLYAEANDRIVRYALTPGKMVPAAAPTIIVTELPMTGDHPMHPIAIDKAGGLFINSGSASNTCEKENRKPGSTGNAPCVEQETRAGIWRYDADKTGQKFSPAARYVTGIRNTGGISFDAAGRMYAVQHGRDQLSQNWPALYTTDQGVHLPAEVMVSPTKGADFGWPMCYYDGFQNKLVLAPEYGGDGGKAVGICASKKPPVAAFPAHWAPNDMLIYGGKQFPGGYRGGAFIAFHGSWNRAPAPQEGYQIVFQPLANGHASGKYIRFADGFAGAFKEPGRATFRPAGLAMGPDGALYIADDVRGRIWRVTYHGPANAPLADAPVAVAPAAAPAETSNAGIPVPPGFAAAQVALGKRIYDGEERGGTCSGCHGSDGRGTSVGPGLTGERWLWGDGSVASIAKVIRGGVANPKQFAGAMPPDGGAPLTPQDVDAVAAYVWSIGKTKK